MRGDIESFDSFPPENTHGLNGPYSCVTAVDENGIEEGLLQDLLVEPIVKMAVAPNGRFLACFSRNGMLAVMTSNFATKVGRGVGCGVGLPSFA